MIEAGFWALALYGLIALVRDGFRLCHWWRRIRHHQQVTEQWRQQHLDPDRAPDQPWR